MTQTILDIVVYAKNNPSLTQKEIANYFDVSVGTVNKAMQHIDDDINKYKVDNAVLFAAGWGNRMSPITDDTPKPLVKVKGEPFIENIIKGLIEKDIKEIYVVVGKFKEKFDYLTEKYGVQIISNPDWMNRNNISSLYFSQNIDGNTLYFECDQIINPNAIRTHFVESSFHGTYTTTKTQEVCFVLNGKKVIDFKKGGIDKYYWNGIVYISKEDKDILISYMNDVYNLPEHTDSLFEKLIINLIKDDKLAFDLVELKEGNCIEFDTVEELAKYDNSYMPFFKEHEEQIKLALKKLNRGL